MNLIDLAAFSEKEDMLTHRKGAKTQCFSLVNIVENKVNQVQNWNSKLTQFARNSYRKILQNFRPLFTRGKPEKLPPTFTRKNLVHEERFNRFKTVFIMLKLSHYYF